MGTFSFGTGLPFCDMTATFGDIGATFSAITVTKCDMAQALPWVGVEESVVGMEIR